MNSRKFGLIASSESTKKAWDTLHKIFEGSRCRNLKKEGDDETLKRIRSQASSREDQEKISRHGEYTTTIIKEDVAQLRKDFLKVNISYCQSRSDSIAFQYSNQIIYNSRIEGGNKYHTEELISKIQKIMQTDVFESRMTI